MARTNQLSKEKRHSIITLRTEGQSVQKMQAQKPSSATMKVAHLRTAPWEEDQGSPLLTPNTPPGSVRAIWPRRRVMECCARWPGLHSHLTYNQSRWFGMRWTAEWWQKGQQVLGISGNSFKTVGNFRWRPHGAHRENAKSVQSSNQSKGRLFWKKYKTGFELFPSFLFTT